MAHCAQVYTAPDGMSTGRLQGDSDGRSAPTWHGLGQVAEVGVVTFADMRLRSAPSPALASSSLKHGQEE